MTAGRLNRRAKYSKNSGKSPNRRSRQRMARGLGCCQNAPPRSHIVPDCQHWNAVSVRTHSHSAADGSPRCDRIREEILVDLLLRATGTWARRFEGRDLRRALTQLSLSAYSDSSSKFSRAVPPHVWTRVCPTFDKNLFGPASLAEYNSRVWRSWRYTGLSVESGRVGHFGKGASRLAPSD